MVYALLLLAVLLVIGPVMWLRPTARQKQLSSIRFAAMKAGIKVTVCTAENIPWLKTDSEREAYKQAQVELVRYLYPLEQEHAEVFNISGQSICFKTGDFLGEWDPALEEVVGHEGLRNVINTLRTGVENCSLEIVGLQVTPFTVAVYWHETGGMEVIGLFNEWFDPLDHLLD
jgi:hypothetical protein